MVTFDYWFPAGEIGSPDLRCLGVLVKADKEVISAPVRFNRWRSTESFPAPTSEEAGRLADLSFELFAATSGRQCCAIWGFRE